ncbi:hypothetical protein BGW36DRAFT_370010 [Talaromyces proteolyticus]|uniref:LYR family protein n=1 Tax=Talaromyces proteolyticus TaxID=1131652 RepID=A0AAD4KZB8_9EURO|nr:uncharacterized protein BGW36DRAFT_370010 [Talaromyces proteolyticus]KAH8703807.1 hypothetical protein BGW36DRAFT_370010 [Talaromyces proteolyticus]
MAPTFRSSRSGRQFTDNASRSRAADNDIFEGLPVRRWTRQNHTVSQDAQIDIPSSTSRDAQPDLPFPELPMPKDSHLLAAHSRALLRAARAGYIYLSPPIKDSQATEEKETVEVDATTPATKMERSYTTRKWSQLPKHLELPEAEFLAKRRAGLPSLYGVAGTLTTGASGATQSMRKVKVKKTDPNTGNVTIYDAWVPEGQKVEGEIKDESQVAPAQPDATVTRVVPPPGTVVEGVGISNTEGVVVAAPAAPTAPESTSEKNGPSPPKRKSNDEGEKGRKRVMFAPGEGVEVGEEDAMAIGDKQDEDMKDEEGEGGEAGEAGAAAVGITSQEQTPQTQPGDLSSEPTPMVLDQDTTPTLQPSIDVDMLSSTQEPEQPTTNALSSQNPPLDDQSVPHVSESPEVKQAAKAESPVPEHSLLEPPQSPVRPESEQLTPPHLSSAAIQITAIEEERHTTTEQVKNVEKKEQKAEVSNSPIPPTTDDSVPQEQAPSPLTSDSYEPAALAVEKSETVEIVQAAAAEPEPVQAKTETEQVQQSTNIVEEVPSEQVTSEPTTQPTKAPQQQGVDLLSSLAMSLENKPEEIEDAQPVRSPITPPEAQETPGQSNITVEPISEPVVGPPPSEPIAAPVETAPPIEEALSPIVAAPPVESALPVAATAPIEPTAVAELAPPVEATISKEPMPPTANPDPVVVAGLAPEPEPASIPPPVPAENKIPEISAEAEPEPAQPAEPVPETSDGSSEKPPAE